MITRSRARLALAKGSLLLMLAASSLLGPTAVAAQARDTGVDASLPTIFYIGDSTVRNGSASGDIGWGEVTSIYFDSTKVNVVNRAVAGRSSRTFMTDGHWARVLGELKRGDFVIIHRPVDAFLSAEGAAVQPERVGMANPYAAYDFVVAKDGSGDFTTIQAAVNAVRDYTPILRKIFIKNGVYHEKLLIPSWKTGITLVGESVEGTIIDYDDHAGKDDINTFTSYTARISGNDIHVFNITFRNSAGPVGQALALFVEGDRVIFENCRFIGDQDTIFAAGEGSRQYFDNVYIEGTTDFIFGPATAYFENCELHSKKNSYITAASTPKGIPYGYVFRHCKLTADPGVNQVYLGRPWRDYARVVFLDTEMGAHIRSEGWNNWSRPETEKTAFYAEYGNTGPGAAREGRVSWSKALTAAQAAEYAAHDVLCRGDCTSVPWYDAEPPR